MVTLSESGYAQLARRPWIFQPQVEMLVPRNVLATTIDLPFVAAHSRDEACELGLCGSYLAARPWLRCSDSRRSAPSVATGLAKVRGKQVQVSARCQQCVSTVLRTPSVPCTWTPQWRESGQDPRRLGVLSRQVVLDSADGWGPDCGVVPVMIVEV